MRLPVAGLLALIANPAFAAPPADAAEFLRRACLDLTGRIPAPRDVHDFLADKDPGKRARLIDALLEGPRYATHFAAVRRAALPPEAASDAQARVFRPASWTSPPRLTATVGIHTDSVSVTPRCHHSR